MKRLLFVLLLAGCAGQPMNYEDSLGAAYATVDALAKTTETLCAAPVIGGDCTGSISTATRNDARTQLQEALRLLDQARELQASGHPDIAVRRIQDAQAILSLITTLLETRA